MLIAPAPPRRAGRACRSSAGFGGPPETSESLEEGSSRPGSLGGRVPQSWRGWVRPGRSPIPYNTRIPEGRPCTRSRVSSCSRPGRQATPECGAGGFCRPTVELAGAAANLPFSTNQSPFALCEGLGEGKSCLVMEHIALIYYKILTKSCIF